MNEREVIGSDVLGLGSGSELFEQRCRLLPSARPAKDVAKPGKRHRMASGQVGCGLALRDRAVMVTLLQANHSQEAVSRPERRFELDRRAQDLGRLVVTARKIESDAELRVDHRRERFQSLRFPELVETLRKVGNEAKQATIPLVCNGVLRIDRNSPSRFVPGGLPVGIIERAHSGQADMRFRQAFIDADRVPGGGPCARKYIVRRQERERAQHGVTVRQTGVCQRVGGILLDRLLEVRDRLLERSASAPVPQVPALEIELIRLAVLRGSVREAFPLGGVQLDPQSRDDFARNVLFHGEDVGEFPRVFLAPQLAIGSRIHEFGLDVQRVVALQDGSREQHSHTQLAHRALQIDFRAFVSEGCAARHDAQSRNCRKIVDQALGDTVAKVIDICVVSRIDEREHRDRHLQCIDALHRLARRQR